MSKRTDNADYVDEALSDSDADEEDLARLLEIDPALIPDNWQLPSPPDEPLDDAPAAAAAKPKPKRRAASKPKPKAGPRKPRAKPAAAAAGGGGAAPPPLDKSKDGTPWVIESGQRLAHSAKTLAIYRLRYTLPLGGETELLYVMRLVYMILQRPTTFVRFHYQATALTGEQFNLVDWLLARQVYTKFLLHRSADSTLYSYERVGERLYRRALPPPSGVPAALELLRTVADGMLGTNAVFADFTTEAGELGPLQRMIAHAMHGAPWDPTHKVGADVRTGTLPPSVYDYAEQLQHLSRTTAAANRAADDNTQTMNTHAWVPQLLRFLRASGLHAEDMHPLRLLAFYDALFLEHLGDGDGGAGQDLQPLVVRADTGQHVDNIIDGTGAALRDDQLCLNPATVRRIARLLMPALRVADVDTDATLLARLGAHVVRPPPLVLSEPDGPRQVALLRELFTHFRNVANLPALPCDQLMARVDFNRVQVNTDTTASSHGRLLLEFTNATVTDTDAPPAIVPNRLLVNVLRDATMDVRLVRRTALGAHGAAAGGGGGPIASPSDLAVLAGAAGAADFLPVAPPLPEVFQLFAQTPPFNTWSAALRLVHARDPAGFRDQYLPKLAMLVAYAIAPGAVPPALLLQQIAQDSLARFSNPPVDQAAYLEILAGTQRAADGRLLRRDLNDLALLAVLAEDVAHPHRPNSLVQPAHVYAAADFLADLRGIYAWTTPLLVADAWHGREDEVLQQAVGILATLVMSVHGTPKTRALLSATPAFARLFGTAKTQLEHLLVAAMRSVLDLRAAAVHAPAAEQRAAEAVQEEVMDQGVNDRTALYDELGAGGSPPEVMFCPPVSPPFTPPPYELAQHPDTLTPYDRDQLSVMPEPSVYETGPLVAPFAIHGGAAASAATYPGGNPFTKQNKKRTEPASEFDAWSAPWHPRDDYGGGDDDDDDSNDKGGRIRQQLVGTQPSPEQAQQHFVAMLVRMHNEPGLAVTRQHVGELVRALPLTRYLDVVLRRAREYKAVVAALRLPAVSAVYYTLLHHAFSWNAPLVGASVGERQLATTFLLSYYVNEHTLRCDVASGSLELPVVCRLRAAHTLFWDVRTNSGIVQLAQPSRAMRELELVTQRGRATYLLHATDASTYTFSAADRVRCQSHTVPASVSIEFALSAANVVQLVGVTQARDAVDPRVPWQVLLTRQKARICWVQWLRSDAAEPLVTDVASGTGLPVRWGELGASGHGFGAVHYHRADGSVSEQHTGLMDVTSSLHVHEPATEGYDAPAWHVRVEPPLPLTTRLPLVFAVRGRVLHVPLSAQWVALAVPVRQRGGGLVQVPAVLL